MNKHVITYSCATKEVKIRNLLKNPIKGGIPPIENRTKAKLITKV
jgi:hypothetical protein